MLNALRHDLIYLKEGALFEILSSRFERPETEAYIEQWILKGLPFIYTRQPNVSAVYLGLTALLHDQKFRIGLCVSENAIAKRSTLPLLKPNIHFYGSFLFQHLSKQAFIDASSDLDILISYNNEPLSKIKDIMNILAQEYERTMDGEVRFLNADISIQELLTDTPTLLMKTVNEVYLISREQLYATYPTLCS